MFSRPRLLVSAAATAVASGSLYIPPAPAQAQEVVLDDIVITARKRQESLQETPVAVSAFSGQELEERGLRDISDLRKVVPNLDLFDGNGTGGAGNIFIRGVGARNTGVNFDSGVGIYIDGVYVSRPDGALLDNVDLQSVQVLRGPQGTLFGKNTTGGAILYTTHRPMEQLEGNAQVRVGNDDRLDGKLALNVPLAGHTLLSRFSLFATTRDGYTESRANGNDFMTDNEEYNDIYRKGAQAQLRWKAAHDMLFDLNYHYAKTDQGARGQDCEVVDDIPGSGWQAELQNPLIVVPSTGKTIQAWCQENNDLGKDRIQTDLLPNKYKAETNTLSVTLDWEMTDSLNFKSITAWRGTDGGDASDLDGTGIPLLHRTNFGWSQAQPRETDTYSQEFQLSGVAFGQRMDYVMGLYFFSEESDTGTAVSPTGPFFGALFNPLQAFYNTSSTEILTDNVSASAFSQVDWNFNDYWRLTLGLRYTWEERELERHFRVPDINDVATSGDAFFSLGNQFIVFPGGPETYNDNHAFVVPENAANPGQPDPLADQKMQVDDSEITPMASLQYRFNGKGFFNNGMAYATVANGYLSGGITDTVSVQTRLLEEFDPEEVWNYELGLKMDMWDRRLRMNMALFYTDYQDRQLTTVRINPDTGRVAGALINAEDSTIAGIEIETRIIPVDNLQITANVTFNDGDIDTFDDERILSVPGSGVVPPECTVISVGTGQVMNCAVDRSDENLPRLPEEIYYLSAQYNWETESGRIIPMLAWSYRKDVDYCFDRASCLSKLYLVDQEDLSARLSWISPDEDLRVTAFGTNLTDQSYIIGGTPLVDATQTAGTIYNEPRMFGVEVAYKF